MMRIALELSRRDEAWDDLATKFLEHFCGDRRGDGQLRQPRHLALERATTGFFYDVLVATPARPYQLRVRSMVGLLPLLAVDLLPTWAHEHPARLHRPGWRGCRPTGPS